MDGMEVDGMDVDQDRRNAALHKLNQRLQQEEHRQAGMNGSQARDILKNLGDLFTGGKITVDNAFDLHGIEALSTLVFTDRDTSARCGEGHFQTAGFGLDISLKIYGKRVDAVYNHAYKTLERKQPANKDNGAGDDAKDQGEGKDVEEQGEGEGNPGAKGAAKAKKRQGPSNSESTLAKDSDLRARVKETTFDTDPFFVRTSRLIDENSPQGLLLHNLPVLYGSDVVFDANVRPQERLRKAQADAHAAGAEADTTIDLSVLPYARDVLAAAAQAPICAGIEELYGLLEGHAELPGLQVAAKVDPQELLRKALAENHRERMQANRNAEVRQVVQQVEDAMDVDMPDAAAGGGAEDAGAPADDTQGGAEADDDGYYAAQEHGGGTDDDDGPMFLPAAGDDEGGGDGFGGEGERRFGGRAASDDEAPYGCEGDGGGEENRGSDDPDDELGGGMGGGEGPASDDESVLLSLLGGTSSSALGSTGTLQRTWWKSRARKPAGALAKPRARKPKPEEVPLDWRVTPTPQLEDVRLHTYKTARRDASNKLCLPQEEPARLEDLCSYFSSAPVASTLSLPVGGMGFQGTHGLGGGAGCGLPVHETWRAMLIADNVRERQRRREGRAMEQQRRRSGLPPHRYPQHGDGDGGGFPAMSDDADGAGGFDDADEYGGGGGGDFMGPGGDYDDGGATDTGGDFSDDELEDSGMALAGGVGGKAGGGPSLEELLQPPRRVQRVAIKFDKTAGVADVATLKTNIEASLKELAVSAVTNRRQSAPAPQPPMLSFQTVLDQVAEHAGEASKGALSGGAAPRPAASLVPPSLAGVSTHLAFICLLHLANEKGLALANGGNMDTLLITGLGDLVT